MKRLSRILAVLMTLVLLLSMGFTTAFAAPCSHENKIDIPAKDATCTETGTTKGTKCADCGEVLTAPNETPALGHDWKAWKQTEAPTSLSKGSEARSCVRCNTTATRDVYPEGALFSGDSGSNVKAAQEKLNAAGYNCGEADGKFDADMETAVKAFQTATGRDVDGVFYPGYLDLLIPVTPEYNTVPPTVSLETISTPANDAYFVEGEKINCKITVTNISNYDYKLMCAMFRYNQPFNTDNNCDESSATGMNSGETNSFTLYYPYEVTATDVGNGYVTIYGAVLYPLNPEFNGSFLEGIVGKDYDRVLTNTIILPTGSEPEPEVINEITITDVPTPVTGIYVKDTWNIPEDAPYSDYRNSENVHGMLIKTDTEPQTYADLASGNQVDRTASEVYEAGKYYSVVCWIDEPNEGYVFSDSLKATVNGDSANVRTSSGPQAYDIWYCLGTPVDPVIVDEINVTDVVVPVVGETTKFDYSIPADAGYDIYGGGSVCWTETLVKPGSYTNAAEWETFAMENRTASAFDYDSSTFVYQEGYYYTFLLTVELKYGSIWADQVKVTVNGITGEFHCNAGPLSDNITCTFSLVPDPINYTIIEGDGQTVTKGNSARFVSDAPFDKFVKVTVDGVEVDAANYTAVSGSTDITLSADFISSLSEDVHSISVVSNDGEALGRFTVAPKKTNATDETKSDISGDKKGNGVTKTNQKSQTAAQKKATVRSAGTGDGNNTVLWMEILGMAILFMIVLTAAKRRDAMK